MRTEQPTKCLYHISYGESGCVHKTSLSPPGITDRSNAVVLTWFSVACVGVRVSMMFHLMFVWGKAVHSVGHLYLLYFVYLYFIYFPFRF